ncbi:MAG: hypothetical protein ACOC58_02790, partial [Chloroflexota bacterium]
VMNEVHDEMLAAYPDEAEVSRIHKEAMPYLLGQAYTIPLPASYSYRFWWRWVGNYSGEYSLGYYNIFDYSKYVWIDQDLKQSMGY